MQSHDVGAGDPPEAESDSSSSSSDKKTGFLQAMSAFQVPVIKPEKKLEKKPEKKPEKKLGVTPKAPRSGSNTADASS